MRCCQLRSGGARWLAASMALGLLLVIPCRGSREAAAAPKPAAGPADPVYAALRAARPDGRVAAVHGLALDRDAFHLELESGAIHFLEPVAGRTVGAVFLGHGTLRLTPATAAERHQLALQLGEGKDVEVFTDSFEELVLLFADDTAQEIGLTATIQKQAPDPRARQVYERWLDRQRDDFRINLQLRLLRDLLNTPGLTSGVFLGLLEGKRLPPSLLAVDPDGAGALIGGALRLGREGTLLYANDSRRGGIWYLSDSRSAIQSHGRLPRRSLARALDYRVETTVLRDADLAGVTVIRFQVLQPGLRVLPIQLMPRLRIAEAAYGIVPSTPAAPSGSAPPAGAASSSGVAPAVAAVAPVAAAVAPAAASADLDPDPESRRAAAVVQEDSKEDAAAAVVFPEPLPKGSQVLLRIAYHGDHVLTDAGDKNYVVEARTSWYPNLGVFSDPAPFTLVYRVPAGNQVVSVGRLVSARELGGQSVSEWKTEGGVRVAGFNYGKFKELKRRDPDSGIDVQVYTNPGTPDIIRTINEILAASSRRDIAGTGLDPADYYNGAPQATLGNVNTSRLAEATMADGINSGRVFTTYFGSLVEKHVAITQQSQFAFGQSWPSLIFMPYIAFLDGTQRQRLGLAAAKDFVDHVGFHEFAHQWWGHLVTADSYRDVWLEEGFAEFSAALAVQHTQGWPAYDRFWREARKEIFARPPRSAVANAEAGPISQGFRLSTERSPYGYQALVYEKGAYVLHMLRMLMWDGADPTPDRRFIAMMHDYAASFAGKQASTADFQQVVERHMAPAMNATGDGKMDWFFNQWVYGTETPHYVADLHLEAAGDQWRIKGKVTQEGVSDTFRALVPISLEFDRGQTLRVGLLPMVGKTTRPVDATLKPPKKPRAVLINAHGEVLARD
jgi:Peptidase family M1 domain